MATLNLDVSEFEKTILIFLFDSVMNPEQVKSESMKKFISNHSSKIKTPLMKTYLDSDSETRLRYKRIKGIFDGSSNSIQQIRIGPSEKIKGVEVKQGIVKKILKKVLKKEELSLDESILLKRVFMEDKGV